MRADTESEIVLAERYAAVLDYVSRAARAMDQGDWRYLWDKLAELRHAVERLQDFLSTEPDPEGERRFQAPQVRPATVRAVVVEHGRYYRAARLLHPPHNGGSESR